MELETIFMYICKETGSSASWVNTLNTFFNVFIDKG